MNMTDPTAQRIGLTPGNLTGASLDSDDDLTRALAGSAILDETLRDVLIACLHDGGLQEEIERRRASITYKVKLGVALGLLSDDVAMAIQIISKARNLFAHWIAREGQSGAPERVSFDHQEVKCLCGSLSLCPALKGRSAKEKYTGTCRYISTHLYAALPTLGPQTGIVWP